MYAAQAVAPRGFNSPLAHSERFNEICWISSKN